jgi:phosphopantetheinyl transferase
VIPETIPGVTPGSAPVLATPGVMVGVTGIDDAVDGRLAAWLDAAERRRAATFRAPTARRRFIVAHGLLRWLLARQLGVPPVDVPLATDRFGRPAPVASPSGDLWWTLSHAGSRVVVAVARPGAVGVDVEPVDPRRADLPTLARFLAPGELAGIAALPDGRRPRALALAWTRLEAEAKGRGVTLDALRGRARTGVLTELVVDDGHVASLWMAVAVPVVRVGWT